MNPINNVSGAVGPSGASPVQKLVTKPVQREVAADAPRQLPAAADRSDRLELSGVSHLLKTLKAGSDVRTEKVAAIRAQIEAGTYEDDKKLDAAVSKLLDDLMA